MNKRIQELVKKAGVATEQEWYRLSQSTDGMPAYKDVFNQKFAELIVRECVEQVFVSIPDTMCAASGAYKTARLAAINNIKEHFGVEL